MNWFHSVRICHMEASTIPTTRSSLRAVQESGGVPVPFGISRDDERAISALVERAIAETDVVVMSGGTSKGAGDVSYRILSSLGRPGIIVHGVALKPGKPVCLAVVRDRPVIVLPGFPTSAIFTFHTFVTPLIRAMAGLPPHGADLVQVRLPVRVPSELGRTEYVMVSLSEGNAGLAAFPLGRGSGSVTAFSQADGFFAIDALADAADAGSQQDVQLITQDLRLPTSFWPEARTSASIPSSASSRGRASRSAPSPSAAWEASRP